MRYAPITIPEVALARAAHGMLAPDKRRRGRFGGRAPVPRGDCGLKRFLWRQLATALLTVDTEVAIADNHLASWTAERAW